jgi:hypothetical protein
MFLQPIWANNRRSILGFRVPVGFGGGCKFPSKSRFGAGSGFLVGFRGQVHGCHLAPTRPIAILTCNIYPKTNETFEIYVWNTYIKHMKHLKNHCNTYTTSRKNTCNICVKHMQHLDKYTCNIHLKTNETLRTDVWNISVQPLQHMQHSDLLLQHPYETLATYPWNNWKTWNIRLQHALSAQCHLVA